MFLQEKLGKLKSATGSPTQPLPPRLTAAAIEAFLDCGWFAQEGCKWVMDKVRGARGGQEGCKWVMDKVRGWAGGLQMGDGKGAGCTGFIHVPWAGKGS